MTKLEWLEDVAREVMTTKDDNIKNLFFAIVRSDGIIETNFFDDVLMDKLGVGDVILRDAMSQCTDDYTEEDMANYENEEETAKGSDKTVKEIYDSMTPEQQQVCTFMVAQALQDAGVVDEEDSTDDYTEEDFEY